MEFEFDPEKSTANQHKHGIGFSDAQVLWDDPDRLLVPAKTLGEKRFMLIGKIGEKHWSAIYTMRQHRVRIISVRRSREEEVEAYED